MGKYKFSFVLWFSGKYHKHRFNKINLKNWVIGEDYISWADHLDKIDPKNEKTRLSLKDDHPNKYGHTVWAEKILEKVNENYR